MHERYPLLLRLRTPLVLAGFSLLLFAILSYFSWGKCTEQILVITLILLIGWTFLVIAKKVESFFIKKYETDNVEEIKKRAIYTKIQVVYRAAICLILLFTLSAVLMTFPSIRALGIGLLGSAGVLGVVLGLAAKPILLNMLAGFQIAFSKMLKIGDAVIVEEESGSIEEIYLTHIVVKMWDLRRMLLPISYFIDKPFYNLSSHTAEVIAVTTLHMDFRCPIDFSRQYFLQLIEKAPLWNRKTAEFFVTKMSPQDIELRLTMSAKNSSDAFKLSCFVREEMLLFFQKEHPEAFPRLYSLNLKK